MNTPSLKSLALALAALAAPALAPGAASAQTAIKVTLPWVFQGPDSFMLVAVDKGYYKEEGLDVTVDAGRGSVDALNKVASGAYEFGFADMGNLVQFASESPDKAPVAVMIVYDEGPFSIFTLKKSGIEKPEDMPGHSLGSPVFDASFKLFPAFAQATGIDESKVERINMDGKLRETMLLRGEVDMISGHYYSSYIDLLQRGAKPEDLTSFLYSDFGVDFYGNAVLVQREIAQNNPELVKKFLRATAKAVKEVLAAPEIGVAAAKDRDGLLNADMELARLKLAAETLIYTDWTRANGFGDADPARLQRSIDQLAGVFALDPKPTPAQVFDASFLPPAEDRVLP